MTRFSALALLLLAFTVSNCFGCFGSSTGKDEKFYNLRGPRHSSLVKSGPKIVVAGFASAAGYDTQRLAYRLSAHEVRYYGYRQWVAEPSRLLREWTMRHLRASKKFAEVTSSSRLREPDAVLYGVVEAVEEVDKGKTWEARLSMTFTLRKGDGEKVLLRHHFDTTRKCVKAHPDEVAKEIGSILEKETARLAERIVMTMK